MDRREAGGLRCWRVRPFFSEQYATRKFGITGFRQAARDLQENGIDKVFLCTYGFTWRSHH